MVYKERLEETDLMLGQKYAVHVGVYLLVMKRNGGNEEILLQQRQNTGYMDGRYDASCSGHLEKGESLARAIVREAREELGIEVDEENLEQAFLGQVMGEDYLKVYFLVEEKDISGTPRIMESGRCGDLGWFDMEKLPEEMASFTVKVLENIRAGVRCGVL